jgi:hypothetical protein
MSWYSEISDYVSKPFVKLYHGDITGGLGDMWKKFTPSGVLYDTIDSLSVRHIHVANATGMPIAVVVSANKDWVYADIAAAVVMTVISLGSDAPAGYEAIKNAKTLWELYAATRYYRAAEGVGSKIYKIFAEKGTNIENSQYQDVMHRSNSNPLHYLDPSQYGALLGASDCTIMMIREDGHTAIFNTNSDTSWIAYPPGYCRAKYGTIWEPEDGPHAWDA